MLGLHRLTVGYRSARGAVLSELDLTISAGDFICVLGRNGAGKSTLMRTLAGLQVPLSGRVSLNEYDVAHMPAAQRAQAIAVVLTERVSSPGLTVDDVIAMGRHPFTGWQGQLTRSDAQIVQEAADRCGARRFLGSLFDSLSDGERQRVMIARAVAQAPRLMVLDEITAFLDLPGRVEVMMLLRRHARDSRSAVLLSSHDLDLSLQLADRIWLLDGAGGLVVGSADELIESGAVARAFDTHSVRFCARRRRFELGQD